MLPQHPHNAGLFCCVVGERRGWGGVGGGGGDRRDLNQLQSEYLPPGEHLSAFGPRPQVSGYFLKRRFLPPFYR